MIGDSSIQPTPGFSGRNQWHSASSTARQTAAASGTEQPADQLDISSAGSLLGSLKEGLFWGVKPDANGAIHLEDVESAYKENLSAMKSQVARLLAENGIDRSQPAMLQTDATGQIVVVGDHPDKEKIEALFRDQPELANEFRHLSATASLLQAGAEAKSFQAAYAKDPHAAVNQYAHLFSGQNQPTFSLSITADAISECFTGS